jgi:8-oxo-dGTP diphosphatase
LGEVPVKKRPGKDGVVAVLQDDEGRYLLIRRGWQLVRAPGVWCFPGGEVEPGESLTQAIEREVLEELGLRVSAREKLHESISPNGEYLLHWLRVEKLEPSAILQPSPDEVAEVVWLSATRALALEPILPALRSWLEKRS